LRHNIEEDAMITTLRFTPAWLATGLFMLAACGDKSPKQAVAKETAPPNPVRVIPTGAATEPVSATERTFTPVTFESGDSAFRARRYDEAMTRFTSYTMERPENPWGFYMLGLSAWKSGDPDRAKEAFRKALALDSTHVKSYLSLSRVLLESNQPDSALEYLEVVLRIDDSLGEAHRLIGRVHEARGEADEAVASYHTALTLDPEDVWSMNNLGHLLIQQGAFEDALRPLARATELAPEVATFQNNLGITLERTGHYTLAAEAYRAALVSDSTFTKASVNLERVAGLTEDPDTPPVDLQSLSEEFQRQIAGWESDEGC
jgi:tetratricopeptide (TPR) repeat protein